MIVKRDKKPSYILIFLIILIASYFTLRVTTLMEQNGGKFNVDYLNITLDKLTTASSATTSKTDVL